MIQMVYAITYIQRSKEIAFENKQLSSLPLEERVGYCRFVSIKQCVEKAKMSFYD
jgi:hypothetical protein